MVEKTIQHNKDFYYTHSLFKNAVIKLANMIRATKKNFLNIYAVPRGGLILGVYLSHELGISLNNHFVLNNTLVVDDICDTGKTLEPHRNITRVALVAKPKGLNIIKDLIYDIRVEDDTWVHFPWEKTK